MTRKVSYESGVVQSYLSILQSVISRMSANSSQCKTWCITMVSAITVIVEDNSNNKYIWVGLVPISLFFFLDSYYLGKEQLLREAYNRFIEKIQSDDVTIEDIFIVDLGKQFLKELASTSCAMLSFSIFPFYSFQALMLVIIYRYIL